LIITKIKEGVTWLYNHPEFVFSAFFTAVGLFNWNLLSGFFFILAGHHLYAAYLKSKNEKMSGQLYDVIVCVGQLVAKMDELGFEKEGKAIAKEHGLILHKATESKNG